MSHDTLAIIWFGLWGLVWAVYFILDGFSLGTGIIFPFITKNRQERNQLQEAIGPFWGGHEVWLVLAGGATFAAFPVTYANMFVYFYIPLMLILFSLFFRAVGLEFMHKDENRIWQNTCKWAFSISSFLVAFLFGVAFANLFYGLPVGKNGMEGGLLALLNSYALLGGFLFVAIFTTAGALWVKIKTEGEVADRAEKLALPASLVASITLCMFFVATANQTPLLENATKENVLYILPALSALSAILVMIFIIRKKIGMAFTFISTTTLFLMATGFTGMYPNMLPSRISEQFSTTLFQAAGSKMNLTLMLWVAGIMLPIVIGYQLWSYTIFKKKINAKEAKGYH
jgi:cytochrome d ubiquinol oxidase subunit II